LRGDITTLFLASLGGSLENFDFVIFAMFIPVIGRLLYFPPSLPEWLAELQTFGIFAAGKREGSQRPARFELNGFLFNLPERTTVMLSCLMFDH